MEVKRCSDACPAEATKDDEARSASEQSKKSPLPGITTMTTHSGPADKELSLSEMLADPIVRAVMARDGVTDGDVEGLITTLRDKLAERRTKGRQSNSPMTGAASFGR